MHKPAVSVSSCLLMMIVACPVVSQSVVKDGDVENALLIQSVATGTAPHSTSWKPETPSPNAEPLGAEDRLLFAFESVLQGASTDLANPDAPCFNHTHRFVDCGNGTVTDTRTQLIWLKSADCLGAGDYPSANARAASLFDDGSGGSFDCSLTDGSRPGDWRLPTLVEFREIVDFRCPLDPSQPIALVGNGSPLSGCFADAPWAKGLAEDFYWTSTGGASTITVGVFDSTRARGLFVVTGNIFADPKTESHRIWAVRGGQ